VATSSSRSRVARTPPLTAVSVRGYKSLVKETRVELGALTVLAGANSSGKSSVMQPLLLLKQTLEASYAPGPLRIDGPNVEFTAAEQFFSRVGKRRSATATELAIGVESEEETVTTTLKRGGKVTPLDVSEMRGVTGGTAQRGRN
jgi:predicted ATPase